MSYTIIGSSFLCLIWLLEPQTPAVATHVAYLYSEWGQLLSFEIKTWTHTKIREGKILENFDRIKTLPHIFL